MEEIWLPGYAPAGIHVFLWLGDRVLITQRFTPSKGKREQASTWRTNLALAVLGRTNESFLAGKPI